MCVCPQLRDVSMAPDMDPLKKNLIIYDMNSGTKFTLTATKPSVREQWLSHAQKLIQVCVHMCIIHFMYLQLLSVFKRQWMKVVCILLVYVAMVHPESVGPKCVCMPSTA